MALKCNVCSEEAAMVIAFHPHKNTDYDLEAYCAAHMPSGEGDPRSGAAPTVKAAAILILQGFEITKRQRN